MPIYETKGTLTEAIPSDVSLAQAYLTSDDMTPILHGFSDVPNPTVIEHIEWKLEADGYHWSVRAFTIAELTEVQLKELSSWVSGQNSDGLGEGFEQQDFAWSEEECNALDDCEGGCEGYGCDDGHMISFDWKTNDCAFERIK